jgi:dipeptidyl-peptidase 4
MRWLVAGLAVCAAVGAAAAVWPEARPQPQNRLTLERLYSMPRLIGTAPRGFAWSPDSRSLAFLWNDEGTNFYDVWMITIERPAEPVRLSRMPRQQPSAAAPDDMSTIEARAAGELERGVIAVEWYPDGRRLLMAFRGDLYTLEPGAEPVRLTETPAAEQQAAFSPDGRWLTSLRNGDLWIRSGAAADGGPPRQLTRLAAPAVAVSSYAWSPSSESLAVIETDRRHVPVRGLPDYLPEETEMVQVHRPFPGEPAEHRRLGLLDPAGGQIRWIDLGGDPQDSIFSYRWSPDGSRLLVDTSDLYVKDRRLLVVEAASGSATEFHRERDPLNVTAQWAAEWAPDGRGVYFLSDRHEDYHVYLLEDAGGEPKRITRGDWAVSDLHVSAAERAIFFVANEGRPEERHVYRIGLDGQGMARISRQSGTHTPTFSPDGRHAAVLFSSDDTPFDLFLTRLDPADDARERRVTTSPIPEFAEYRWLKAQYVTFPSHHDGATLHGRMTLPPDLDRTKKYPAVIGSIYSNTVRNQWGGRTAHPTWAFDQYLAQEGYVLLNINIRGSWGHGTEFRRGIRLDYGGIDVEDVYSGLRYLQGLAFVDPDRIGIWGSSYGGLLTTMSLFKKPGEYRAGVAGAPATNVWHAMTGEMRVMMRPQDHPEEYANASAFMFADGLQDPLMFIHGMRDRVVLFKDTVSLVQRLIVLDKREVELVALPDAEHAWAAGPLYQTRFAFEKLAAHFERYLGKGPR